MRFNRAQSSGTHAITLPMAVTIVIPGQPFELIGTIPGAPANHLARIRRYCNEIVSHLAPYCFSAVGEFYENFPQLEDDEVVQLLESVAAARAGAITPPLSI